MSTILKHRRGGDEKDCEAGRFHSKFYDDDSVDSKSKHRMWNRGGIWKKRLVGVVVFSLLWLGQRSIMPKTPKLPVLHVDIEVPDGEDWPLIHIVQSRFMQDQGPLETLGMARLKLFEAFCLPSMVQQSSQEFFWIIKTDPQFTKTSVFEKLVELVESYQNIYVVASNTNFVFGSAGREGSWRDGKEALDLLRSKIYTGDIAKLKAAMALRNEKPVLETRLDADDGLHKSYIEYIQEEALKRFLPDNNSDEQIPNWLYWCSRRHIEWHSDTDKSLSKEQEANLGNTEVGYMNIIQHDKLCVTPGITVGYNTIDKTTTSITVPQYDHDVLYKNVHDSMSCYDTVIRKINDDDDDEVDDETRGPCLELIEDFIFCAIRSRTWTSAGMDKIDLVGNDGNYQEKEFTDKLWLVSNKAFGVTEANVKETQEFLVRNKKAIALENLLGQCSSGHSCKDSAKEKLREIINSKTNERR